MVTPITIDGLPTLTINNLGAYSGSFDAVNDLFVVYQKVSSSTVNVNRNTALNLGSAPVGLTDTQTLTNKTLTSPTISGPTMSGTLTGTYTIGGTPTFPSSVVTLTGTQTLTNKTLTSPTINSPSITNATITADTVAGFTSSNTGTIYGIGVSGGQISSGSSLANGIISSTQIASATVTPANMAAHVATGVIAGATLGSTGNKSVTGVEFKPQYVRFIVQVSTSSNSGFNYGIGAMTSSTQYVVTFSTGSDSNSYSSTSNCIAWITGSSSTSTPALLASYVSMDSGGFTINVTTASSVLSVIWEAWG